MASMLVLLCVSWLALAAAAWSAAPALAPYALEDAELHFESFIQKYERNYADENEKQARFQIFKENLKKMNSLNKNSKHAVFGITQFSDLSIEEFKSKFTCLRDRPDSRNSCKYIYDTDINYNDAPESFNWGEQGVVTPVKDQKTCGSCFAFSTIGSIESQYAIKHKELLRLSEQQIVDCDGKNLGCHGGLMDVAIRSLIDQGGCESEADYPYQGTDDNCRFNANKVKVQITDCRSYNLTSQNKLMQLLYHVGPVVIGIKADALMTYQKGIISDEECDSGDLDHAVLLVGYGSEDGMPFWIVKNSWGTIFGEEGYFRMHRGDDALSCGMMNEDMVTPIVA